MKRSTRGFTIVELLIVIVVIAILAAISIVAYTGIQARARDSIRADSITKIKRALTLHKTDVGYYPWATANPGWNGWEASTDASGTFMESLSSYGFPNGAPIDPVNDGTDFFFLYYKYPAGSGGCAASRGDFYVIIAFYANAANKPSGKSITGCSSPQEGWSDGAWGDTHYATHVFENE